MIGQRIIGDLKTGRIIAIGEHWVRVRWHNHIEQVVYRSQVKASKGYLICNG